MVYATLVNRRRFSVAPKNTASFQSVSSGSLLIMKTVHKSKKGHYYKRVKKVRSY